MPLINRPLRWTCRTALLVAAPVALLGCGGGDPAPPQTAVGTQNEAKSFSNNNVQYFPPGPEFPYANTQAATLRARMQAQGVPPAPAAIGDQPSVDQANAAAQDGIRQTSAEVNRNANDFLTGIKQATGDARDQATQATSSAVDGARGFATEVGTGARQSATDAASAVKQGVNDSVQEAKTSIQGAADSAKGQVQSAVAGAKTRARDQARSVVEDAKAKARRQAQAAGAQVQKSAEELEGKVLDGLLGTDSRSAPK